MDLTATLASEHELVLHVLEALEAWAVGIERVDIDGRAELGRFLVFLHRFVDGSHHAKEEEVLFRALVACNDAEGSDLIASLLHEHERGRELLGRLEDLAYQPHPWTDADRRAVGRAIADYVGPLRLHIAKEEQFLLPMARARLDEDTTRAITREAARFELAQPEQSSRLRALAEELVDHYCAHCEHVHHAVTR